MSHPTATAHPDHPAGSARPGRPNRRRGARVLPLVLAAALLVPACGSDGDDAGSDDGGPTTEAPAPTAPTSSTDGDVVEVTAVDFEFQGLPATVKAGTKLQIANDAPTELHELVAIKLPAGEERSVEDLLALPEEEVGALLGGGPPAAVLLAAPGGEQIAAVGDGTLTEPGRYLVMCSIPTGADPQAYLDAAASGEQPEGVEGIPHFAHGMHAELTVE